MNRPFLLATLAGIVTLSGYAMAGPERVSLPQNYRDSLIRYLEVDRPDRKIVRFMYVNPEASAVARPGENLPEGTVLIMEDRAAELDASGAPKRTVDGRMVATDKVLTLFVMEKRKGWGADYPADKRNGDWDYATFNGDGTRRADAKHDGCFACHKNRSQRDFTFTYWKSVADGTHK
jgi:hypothetical protein